MDIDALVRSVIGDRVVDKVVVEEDADRSGYKLLRITVVYDPASGGLDTGKMLDVSEKVMTSLVGDEASGFPILSFISTEDMNSLHAAE